MGVGLAVLSIWELSIVFMGVVRSIDNPDWMRWISTPLHQYPAMAKKEII
jgi:hypothetical protein